MPNDVIVDSLVTNENGSLTANGSVAMRLQQSNFNVNALRPCTIFRKNEWELLDLAVISVARQRLVAVGHLISRGLTMNVPNALGITRVEWEQVSDTLPAQVSMDGLSQSENDRPVYTLNGIPLPIVHKDFHVNLRALETSRRMGMPFDTTMAELATKVVAEQVESLLFNGSSIAGTNNKIFGYTSATNRNTGSITSAWATGANVMTDILAMMSALAGDHMFGPYGVYVTQAHYISLLDDFKANSDKSILGRILEIPEIEFIAPTENLASNAVLMVQLTKDVVDMLDGIQPTIVQWDEAGGFKINFKVLTIMVPRIKDDAATQSGIAHYS